MKIKKLPVGTRQHAPMCSSHCVNRRNAVIFLLRLGGGEGGVAAAAASGGKFLVQNGTLHL